MRTESSKHIRAAIVGAGYISEFHARAIQATSGVELVSVCDANLDVAQAFAAAWNVSSAYDSLESMIAEQRLDCVHILAPPDLHHGLAKLCLQRGTHVFLEKPMIVTVAEADDLLNLAGSNGLYIGVNHNMMFMDAYQRLRDTVRSGKLGPIDHIAINWFSELAQIRLGPFNTWMLRAPGNVVLETGPHLLSVLLDLGGVPDKLFTRADREVVIPGGLRVFRRWRVDAVAGRLAAQVSMNFGPGFNERSITVHGLNGKASADLNANTCLVDLGTALDVDFDRHRRSRSLAAQLRSQSRQTLRTYILSKLKLRRGGNPYQLSFLDSVATFYSALRSGAKLDPRIDGAFGREVTEYCTRAVEAAGIGPVATAVASVRKVATKNAPILVLGGSGFIGRELIRQLIGRGRSVRAMVRGSGSSLETLDSPLLEIVQGDIRRKDNLKRAMEGVEYVYQLAVGQAKTWDQYRRNEVDSARVLGELCLASGVKRLIYTGTIDSFYAGAKAGTITEATPLDANIVRRNYYARAKAAAEQVLMDLHRSQKLPVVILRPGIVIGAGGNAFHWGVGRFSQNSCEVWGAGTNPLPLVLVNDVASALIKAIDVPQIEGRSYNLVDAPFLTARDYLSSLQEMTAQKLTVIYRPIWRLYLSDLAKWIVKMMVHHPDRIRVPSYHDWESRTQKAAFNCDRARSDLGWAPCSSRERLVKEGIGGALESWLAAIK
jgi:predicted dehydrogenase/nucleoside-diphosphate-sugar epimerase